MKTQEFDHLVENLSQRLHVLVEEKPVNVLTVLSEIIADLKAVKSGIAREGLENYIWS